MLATMARWCPPFSKQLLNGTSSPLEWSWPVLRLVVVADSMGDIFSRFGKGEEVLGGYRQMLKPPTRVDVGGDSVHRCRFLLEGITEEPTCFSLNWGHLGGEGHVSSVSALLFLFLFLLFVGRLCVNIS